MRILVTADVQAEWSCLPQCRQALCQIKLLVKQYDLDAVVVAGDLKAAYDPVQVRVIQFWQGAIHQLRKLGVRVLVLLGNHDRIGMYSDAQNWLSILRRAGAETFDTAEVVDVGNGTIAMLPFTTSVSLLRKRAARLAKQGADVLVFHADVRECRYNALGEKSHARVSVAELHPEMYKLVVGGHIHMPQKYYVGSPFCTEWGEANQRKRFLLWLDGKTLSIDSEIPGWFDESWPGFKKPASWEGTHVRVHVDCESSNYLRRMQAAASLSNKRFRGASISILPKFGNAGVIRDTSVGVGASDEANIAQYVAETLPARLDAKQVVGFLSHKVDAVARRRRVEGAQIRITGVEAQNVLSFKKVECRFDQPGITCVEGVNHDWNGQSNGAGKTSLLSLISVAWSGTTFKGQKFDGWARQGTKRPAWVKLHLQDAVGTKLDMVRGRRPVKLQLWVNGHDQSAGMNRSAKDGTQALIEQVTGFTWQTLANSVYIDRATTDAFLRGTKKDRADLLYRFQNLERFEKALLLVRDDTRKHGVAIEQAQAAVDMLDGQVVSAKEHLQQARDEAQYVTTHQHEQYRNGLTIWKALHQRELATEKLSYRTQRVLEPKYKKLNATLSICEGKLDSKRISLAAMQRVLDRNEALPQGGKCPMCGSTVDAKRLGRDSANVRREMASVAAYVPRLESNYSLLRCRSAELEAKIDTAKLAWAEAKSKAGLEYDRLRFIKRQLSEQRDRERKSVADARKNYLRVKEQLIEYKAYVVSLQSEEGFYAYCEHALSRDGLPAFLIAQLAVPLTKAAEDYAALFADGEIQVRFEAEGGGVEPRIINAHGGGTLGDQSLGESAVGALIAAFALREIAPRTNLLILDEPGLGMTAHNLRMLARGLVKLKRRFPSIFVITHSPFLAGELAGERVMRVEKRDGISRLVQ